MNMPSPIRVDARSAVRLFLATALGLAAALLVSCGSSNTGLIPASSAGPLREDFEAVAEAAESGNGNCAPTESALGKAEQDFLALPANLDAGLHARLSEGIANLRHRALSMCVQPTPAQTTATNTQTTDTSPTTPPTTTQTTPTTPATPTGTITTPTEPSSPNEGGGTAAPREDEEARGKGKGKDKGKDEIEEEGDASGSVGGASAGGG